MADYKIKSNLNLYGNSINNFAIQADSGFPASPIMGRTQFYTGGGEYANHIVVYDGKAWKAVAYTDDVKNNADFINLKARVDAFLDGGVNSNDVLDNLREIQQFLDTYGDTTKLVDLLGEINDDIAEQADRISDLESKATQVSVSQTITAGKEIGKVTIDGNTTKLFAPANYHWNEIEGTPRTLDGYGILDGVMYKGVSGANASGASWMGYTYNTTEHGGAVAGGVIQAGGENNAFQLNGGYEGKALYYRGKNSGVFTDWKQVAFTDGRVAGFRIIPYATGMDANTALANGGIVSNYNMSSNGILNAPSGMTYGSIVEFAGGFGTDYSSLAGQLAWDINHNSKDDTTRRLWWRANDETKFANAKWHQIAFMDAVLPLSGGTIDSAGFAPLKINRSKEGFVAAIEYSSPSGTLGYIGFKNTAHPLFVTSTLEEYPIIHKGNIGDFTAGAANKLAKSVSLWGNSFDGTSGIDSNIKFGFGNAMLSVWNDAAKTDYTIFAQVNPEGHLLLGQGTAKNKGGAYIYGDTIRMCYGTSGSSANTAMLINNSGNVTIGSEDKAGSKYKLYVGGHIAISNELIGVSNSTYDKWSLSHANDTLYIQSGKTDGSSVYGKMMLSGVNVNNLSVLTIRANDTTINGNLLLGATEDNGSGAKLQVNGGITATSAVIGGSTTINGKLYANAGADIAGDVYVDGNVHITGNLFAEKELGGGGVGTPATGGGTGGGTAASGLFAVKRISEGVQTIVLNHGLDTRNLVICIYEKDENALTEQWNMCLTDVEIISEMEIRVSFGSATTTEHKVVIMGAA